MERFQRQKPEPSSLSSPASQASGVPVVLLPLSSTSTGLVAHPLLQAENPSGVKEVLDKVRVCMFCSGAPGSDAPRGAGHLPDNQPHHDHCGPRVLAPSAVPLCWHWFPPLELAGIPG